MVRGSNAVSMVATSRRAKKMTISRITCSASVEVGECAAREGEAEPDPVLFEVVLGIAEVSGCLRLERCQQPLLQLRGDRLVSDNEVADVAAVHGGVVVAGYHTAVVPVHRVEALRVAPPLAEEVVARQVAARARL